MQINVARAFSTPADDVLVGDLRSGRAATAREPGRSHLTGFAGLSCLAASAGARRRDAS